MTPEQRIETVYDILTAAAACRRKDEQVKTILGGTDTITGGCDGFKEYLHYVLDPKWNYYFTLKGLPEPRQTDFDSGCGPTLRGMFDLLETLHNRDFSSGVADQVVATWTFKASPLLRQLFKWAIDRKLPGGIGRTIVNKAIPGHIYKQPYPGVCPWDAIKAEKFPWSKGMIWQEKADGMALMIDTGTREVRTRQGQDVSRQMAKHLHPLFLTLGPGVVLFVEANLWEPDFKTMMPRPKSNGWFNAIFKSGRELDSNRIVLTCLDAVPVHEWYGHTKPCTSNEDRYQLMTELLAEYNTAKSDMVTGWPELDGVATSWVYSLEEARAMTQRVIANGGEGGILKVPTQNFKNGKSGMKMKHEFELTLKVIGWKPHAKQAGWVGSLQLTSHGGPGAGHIVTFAGSGLNEEPGHDLDRTRGFEPFEGCLVEIRAEKISKNFALDLPRIVEIRHDKDRADTLDEVQQAYDDSTSLGPDVY